MDKSSKIYRLPLSGDSEWMGNEKMGESAQRNSLDDGQAKQASKLRIPTWKRTLDLSFILIASPVWVPLMVIAVIVLKIVSPGPVFYQQRRIGLGGAEFMIFKFRSMKLNAETHSHEGHLQELIKTDAPMIKLDSAGDPRLIPGGRLFRATGLDELPQIFNVIRGEMTLVGPRPCTPCEFSHYSERQKRRVEVPQGITGLWQIKGKNKMTFSQMIDWDLHYAQTMSPWVDITTILKTIPALVSQVIDSKRKSKASEER